MGRNPAEKRSGGIPRALRIGAAAAGMILAALLMTGLIALVILPREETIHTSLPAMMLCEDGTVRACEVRLDGKMRTYPFQNESDRFYGFDDENPGIRIQGTEVLRCFIFQKGAENWQYQQEDQYYLSRDLSLFVAVTSLKTIDPNGSDEDMGCILVAPAEDEGEARDLLAMLKKEHDLAP